MHSTRLMLPVCLSVALIAPFHAVAAPVCDGAKAYDSGDYVTAAIHLKKAAEQRHAEAQL